MLKIGEGFDLNLLRRQSTPCEQRLNPNAHQFAADLADMRASERTINFQPIGEQNQNRQHNEARIRSRLTATI